MSEIKFTAEMAALRKKLNFVRNGLGASKTDLPVMLVRFNISGNKLTMFCAAKEVFCRTEMKITRDDDEPADGAFSVLGSKIVQLMTAAEAEQISFRADTENVEIMAGFLTVNLTLYDGSPLKQIESGIMGHLEVEGCVVDRSALEESLVCAKSCTTSSSIRPDVTHIELRDQRMLSSDGRKIMIYSNDGFDKNLQFKVPATALNQVIAAVKNVEAEKIQIVVGESYYCIRGNLNEYTLGVRKVEREFPSVEKQIESASSPDDEISVDKHVFEAALRGVAIGLESDEVRVQIEASGNGSDAYLEVSARNSLGRRSFERSSCGRTGDAPISFPVSYRHILDTLNVFKGDSVVDISVMVKMNLAMIRDVTEDRQVTTIVPFRTDAQIEKEKQEAAAAEEARKGAQNEEIDNADDAADLAAGAVESEQDIDLDD